MPRYDDDDDDDDYEPRGMSTGAKPRGMSTGAKLGFAFLIVVVIVGIGIGIYFGVNYETETILDEGLCNAIPPSRNSDKPQISGWSNKNGGFEDYYEKVDMDFIKSLMEKK